MPRKDAPYFSLAWLGLQAGQSRDGNSEMNIKKQITKYLGDPTFWLVIVTFLLVVVTWQLADITEEFYEYHPPNVNVVYGQVVKLYVFRNESYGTYFSIVGVSHVYNSGIADDDAVVRQKHWGLGANTTIEEDLGFSLIFVQRGVVIQRIRGVRKIDARLSFEGSPYPIPVPAGGPTAEIPILLTSSTKEILELNSTLNLIIGKDIFLEVIHPITKELIDNVTALESINITYVMGDDTAKAETIDGRKLILDVRYTEDVDTYTNWKERFMSSHGIDAKVLIYPPKI